MIITIVAVAMVAVIVSSLAVLTPVALVLVLELTTAAAALKVTEAPVPWVPSCRSLAASEVTPVNLMTVSSTT